MSRVSVSVQEALLEPGARDLRRARTDWIMRRVVEVAAFLAVLPLFALVMFVTLRALPWLNPEFFFNNPLDAQPGILNAIIGSLQMSALALLVTGPIGVAGGVYLSEFASARVASFGEMAIDILLGIPSIVAGLFAFLLLVPILGFSGWAGSLALGVLTLPIVMRTTQEVMRLVPPSIREASLALGIPVWRTTLLVTLRTALPGVLTGLVLAASRALGETAPLIMTAKGRNILLQHDVSNPRPYSRLNGVQGTKGVFEDYPARIYVDGQPGGERFGSIDPYKKTHEHPLWTRVGELARKKGGHGGMDFIMAYRLVECMREGLVPDMDVYDAASWSAPMPLSQMSVAKGSAPMQFPDFTRGQWQRAK